MQGRLVHEISHPQRSPRCLSARSLGDDLIDPRDTLLGRMLDVRDGRLGSVVALLEMPPEQVHLYGCAAVEPAGEEDVVRVTGLVEKPAPHSAPSPYAVIGRYVLAPDVFRGQRYDTGDKADHLRTVVRVACERPDLRPEFTAWLKGFVAGLDDACPARRDIAA
ncbi:UTP--glucose-1-phosphate uridylyltransferase [Streptomyces sp. Go-475]|nr:UTP--glucose-1-phosphate uridylyltransferase [Streptomyces sp. Go-475]